MNSSDYRELRRLFHAVQEGGLRGLERSVFLEREGVPPELRVELDRLLRLADVDTVAELAVELPPVNDAAPLPDRLGPYRIEGEIGRGGMGIVHAAVDTRLDRTVALKQLPAPGSGSPDDLSHEAKLLASLHHPNVGTIFSFEEIDGIRFCTLELVAGESLAAMLARGPLDSRSLSSIGRQICAGLDAAHEAGVIHLDLKPANVMVDERGCVKILDFGIGRRLDDNRRTARIAGTPGYMSPEQIRGEQLDPRSDLWSLGSVLYECATGEPAVTSGTYPEMIQRTLDAPIDVRERGLVSSVGAEVLRRLLHPDPAARPASAREARREIDRWIASDLAESTESGIADEPQITASQLPVVFTKLFGREALLSEVTGALERERIVTLVGFGGVGKTRLAVEAAHRADREAVWVPLASVESADRLPAAVAEAFGLEESSRSAFEVVVESIGEQPLLVVLDNGEQLVEALSSFVGRLVQRCSQVTVLVTSRERLGLSAERAIEVGPLSVPGLEQLRGNESLDPHRWPSVALFIERAERLGVSIAPDEVTVVGELCRRLDGLPLAIELATSRLRALSVRDLAERLERRFDLLRDRRVDGPEHHRTLRTAIEWSVDLLGAEERELLTRLSVFRDGWTLRAAEAVVSDDALEEWAILDRLTSLVEKSLVRVVRSEADGLRYRMWESVREWARSTWSATEEAARFLERFVDYYVEESESIAIGMESPRPIEAVSRGKREHGNLLAAIEVSLSGGVTPRGRAALQIGSALLVFWETRGFHRSGSELLEQALEWDRGHGDDDRAPETVRARALNALANLNEALGDQERALACLEECLQLCRSIGFPSKQGVVLTNTAISLRRLGRTDEARRCYAEALAISEREGDLKLEGLVRLNLSILQRESGDTKLGVDSLLRAREIAEERRDVHSLAYCESSLGVLAIDRGDDEEAEARLTRAHQGFAEIGDVPSVARTTSNLSLIASRRGDHARAEELLREALRSHRQIGNRRGAAIALVNLVPNAVALMVEQPDRFERGRAWLAECVEILLDLGEPRVSAYAIEAGATIRAASGELAAAVELASAASEHRLRVERPMSPSEAASFRETLDEWRASLGSHAFDEAWERGAARKIEEVLPAVLAWARDEPGAAHRS